MKYGCFWKGFGVEGEKCDEILSDSGKHAHAYILGDFGFYNLNNKNMLQIIEFEMQYPMKYLVENKHVYSYKVVDDFEIVKDNFWVHPDSIKLFNTFPTMLVKDSIYKSNKYHQLPTVS